jgi:DNA-binding response OmpR family regulator
MSLHLQRAEVPTHAVGLTATNVDHPVVLVVEDHQDPGSELKQVLELNGYSVIDTDNGQEAARRARQIQPDLLLVDLDVPLLYGLVAARQIIKHAELGPMPVVIVTHEDAVDPAPMMEVGAHRDEYVTRLSDYDQLEQLLDYLLPVSSPAAIQLSNSPNRQRQTEKQVYANAYQPT